MFQLQSGAVAVGNKANFDFSLFLPIRRAPGENQQARRLTGSYAPHFKLGPIAEPLVEPAADPRFEKNVLGALSAKGETLLKRPPCADFRGEHLEGDFRRAVELDRFSN